MSVESSTPFVDIEFRITPEDSATLIEEAVERRLSDYDRRSLLIGEFAGRFARVGIALAPIVAVTAEHFLGGPFNHLFGMPPSGPTEKFIAYFLVSVIYWLLWWRYRKKFAEFIDAYLVQHAGRTSRGFVARRLHGRLSRQMKRLEGLHRVRMNQDGLILHGPNGTGRPVHIPWRKITRIDDTPHFYKISTAMTRRFGLRYLVAKRGSGMDTEAYQAGLRFLLEKSPVAPIAN